jgi:hypothetical protein
MTNMFPREDVLNDLDVLLVLYPGEDDSPMVNAALLITDADAALVADLPPDVEEEHAGPMPVVEVCCVTSGSFFDVIRCGDGLMAFPTAPAPVPQDGELVGHVGVDSGMVWLGDPCYLAGEEGDLVDAILHGQTGGVSTPRGDLGGIAVPTAYGDGVYSVFAHRDDDGRIVRLEVDFAI